MIFVLFCWGRDDYNKQALLAAKSVLARSDSAKILVFASRPELFVDERIKVIPITKSDLKSWKGPLNYFLRPKIHILKQALLNMDDNEAMCYLDSDMYCYGFPGELGSYRDKILMFSHEGRVSNDFHPKLHSFLVSNKKLLADNNYSNLTTLEMYNSGLIHLPASTWRLKALEEVLCLTDFLCIHFPQQTTWLEQVSFSHVLPKFSKIKTSSNGLNHYWGSNSEIGYLLSKMSVEKIQKIAESQELFDELCIDAESIKKRFSNKRRLAIKKHKKSIVKRLNLLKARYYLAKGIKSFALKDLDGKD